MKFPNDEYKILPGQYALLTIESPVPTARAIIPQSAATNTQGNYFVMVVDKSGKVSTKPITVGQEQGSNFVVNSGLEDGELLITNNLQKLSPGMQVKYKKVTATNNQAKPEGAK